MGRHRGFGTKPASSERPRLPDCRMRNLLINSLSLFEQHTTYKHIHTVTLGIYRIYRIDPFSLYFWTNKVLKLLVSPQRSDRAHNTDYGNISEYIFGAFSFSPDAYGEIFGYILHFALIVSIV